MFNKNVEILCLDCGLECTVGYMTCFKKWRRKVRYCPHCGNCLGEIKVSDIWVEEVPDDSPKG